MLVRAGRIEALLDPTGDDGAEPLANVEAVDCRERVLLPGLVNAHVHPELILLRGLLEGLSLHEWAHSRLLNDALAVLRSAAGRPLQRAATRATLAECLLGGQTCVVTYGVSDGMEAICADALAGLGLRGWITVRDATFRSRDGEFAVPHMYRLHAEEALHEPELEAAARAHERGERIVMHAAETRTRRRIARQRFGAPTVQVLERFGLLSSRVLLSHAVFLDDGERELIVRRRSPVLASPAAEMKMADGVAPIARLLQAGATVALGTDAAVCNNGNDLLLEARTLGLLQRLHAGPDTLPAAQLLALATAGGARALDADRFGRIEPGQAADLTLIDARSPRMQPLHAAAPTAAGDGPRPPDNVAANIVFAATGQDVRDVMIGGEWRVRDGRPLGFDMDEVGHELAHASRALLTRIA